MLKVLDDLNQSFLRDLGNVVDETEGLDDLLAINGGGVVVEELLVEIRGEGRVDNLVLLAEVRPGLQMLVVSDVSDGLHGKRSGNARLDRSHEVSLDAEHCSDELVDRALIGIARVCQVEDGLVFRLGSNQEERLDHIAHVDRVQTKALVPKALHRLLELLVDCSHDQTGRNTSLVAGAVHNRGANDVVLHSGGGYLLLGLQRGLGERSPRLELRLLIGWLLHSSNNVFTTLTWSVRALSTLQKRKRKKRALRNFFLGLSRPSMDAKRSLGNRSI